jgi:catechol 1,2-dioxygenase
MHAGPLSGCGIAPLANFRAGHRLEPTEAVGNVGERATSIAVFASSEDGVTEPDVIGPFYRNGAPYRAKISPPRAKGDSLLIAGCVQAADTGAPLASSLIEVWQASADGHYDNEDPQHPPPTDSFANRARIVTDEDARYLFETIYPGPYKFDGTRWRAPHIHYVVRARGYKTLVTQLFFQGAIYNDIDPFIKQSLIRRLLNISTDDGGAYLSGEFDIILASEMLS